MLSAFRIPPELTRITTSALNSWVSCSLSTPLARPTLGKIPRHCTRRAFHQFRAVSPHAHQSWANNGFGCRWDSRRGLHGSGVQRHGSITRPAPGTGITLHFKDHKGNLIRTIEASEGDDVLSLAHEWDIDLEGACEGSIACSTCHVILPPEQYDLLPEPSDDENDMLDLAFGLTDTSRLGCQVLVTKDMDGMDIHLPSATRNMFVDGKKPTHH
ncbi:ferredoxin [Paxillus ammoniavirescens]|nr:ferredoxin [Paxillus ammoniavirescens]